jgi:hypothetical protein
MMVEADRRSSPRVSVEHTSYSQSATLRPGQDVTLVNLSTCGALVRSTGRMNPGVRTELQLVGPSGAIVSGRVDRCRVISVNPLKYEAAILFDAPLAGVRTGSE